MIAYQVSNPTNPLETIHVWKTKKEADIAAKNSTEQLLKLRRIKSKYQNLLNEFIMHDLQDPDRLLLPPSPERPTLSRYDNWAEFSNALDEFVQLNKEIDQIIYENTISQERWDSRRNARIAEFRDAIASTLSEGQFTADQIENFKLSYGEGKFEVKEVVLHL